MIKNIIIIVTFLISTNIIAADICNEIKSYNTAYKINIDHIGAIKNNSQTNIVDIKTTSTIHNIQQKPILINNSVKSNKQYINSFVCGNNINNAIYIKQNTNNILPSINFSINSTLVNNKINNSKIYNLTEQYNGAKININNSQYINSSNKHNIIFTKPHLLLNNILFKQKINYKYVKYITSNNKKQKISKYDIFYIQPLSPLYSIYKEGKHKEMLNLDDSVEFKIITEQYLNFLKHDLKK